MKKTLFALMILALLMPIGSAYAWGERDNSDRLSNDQAGVFSPGYINAAKQQAYSVINQNNQSKSWWESLVDKVKDKMANKVEEQGNTKVQPEVKKKTSARSVRSTVSTTNSILIDSTQYDVPIGTGTDQCDIEGNLISETGKKLVSEIINGIRHVYAGFANVGTSTIQEAVDISQAGDRVIVSGGTYYESVRVEEGDITLYGGYNDLGERDIRNNETKIVFTPTWNGPNVFWSPEYSPIVVIGATKLTEINGFTVENDWGFCAGIYITQCTNEIRVINNTFEGYSGDGGLYVFNGNYPSISSNVVISNNHFDGQGVAIRACASGIIVDNNIIENSYYGVLTTSWGDTTVTNNFFGNNDYSLYAYFYDEPVTGIALLDVSSNTFYGGYANIEYARSGENNVFVEILDSGWDDLYNNLSNSVIDDYNSMGLDPSSGIYTSNLATGYGFGASTGYGMISSTTIVTETVDTSLSNTGMLSSDYHSNISNSNMYGTYGTPTYAVFTGIQNNNLSSNMVSGILRGLLANKNALRIGMGTPLNEAVIGRLVTDSLSSAVGVPSLIGTEGRGPEMQIALALANILKNPTEDQKAVLDAVEALLLDMKNINEKAGANPELAKAESDLLQMVASVLLAQGVPDLLKAGDIEGVRGIFKDLGRSKDSIMLDYNDSIKPYYNSIVKDLTANFAILQLKGMLSRKITEEELKNLEPREIDRLIENIRKANDKSFELQYILQQDAKYRKEYLEPSNKALEANMKLMLNNFTQRISKALEDKK